MNENPGTQTVVRITFAFFFWFRLVFPTGRTEQKQNKKKTVNQGIECVVARRRVSRGITNKKTNQSTFDPTLKESISNEGNGNGNGNGTHKDRYVKARQGKARRRSDKDRIYL